MSTLLNWLSISLSATGFPKLPLFLFWGALFFPLLLLPACKKRDRLTVSTYNLVVTPPAAEIVKGQTLSFAAQGVSADDPRDVSPTWAVSDASIASINTQVGSAITLTGVTLGDVVLTATHDGVTTSVPVAIVTYKPNANTFDVYTDVLPSGNDVSSDIFGTPAEQLDVGYTPQGNKYIRAASAPNNSFWGITLDKEGTGKRKDLSSFSNGSLKFALRLGRILAANERFRVDITNSAGMTTSVLLDTQHGLMRTTVNWQEISIPLSEFSLSSFLIRVPFAVSPQTQSSITYDVDGVHWLKPS